MMADQHCLSLYFRPEDVTLKLGKMASLMTSNVCTAGPETSKADGVPTLCVSKHYLKPCSNCFLNNSSHPALMAATCFSPLKLSMPFFANCLFFILGETARWLCASKEINKPETKTINAGNFIAHSIELEHKPSRA